MTLATVRFFRFRAPRPGRSCPGRPPFGEPPPAPIIVPAQGRSAGWFSGRTRPAPPIRPGARTAATIRSAARPGRGPVPGSAGPGWGRAPRTGAPARLLTQRQRVRDRSGLAPGRCGPGRRRWNRACSAATGWGRDRSNWPVPDWRGPASIPSATGWTGPGRRWPAPAWSRPSAWPGRPAPAPTGRAAAGCPGSRRRSRSPCPGWR